MSVKSRLGVALSLTIRKDLKIPRQSSVTSPVYILVRSYLFGHVTMHALSHDNGLSNCFIIIIVAAPVTKVA
jgi:hypothetical protein